MSGHFLQFIEVNPRLTPDWKSYPFNIPAICKMGRLEFHPSVTFLAGENGSGKSTLAEAIAIKAGFNPEGGTKNFTSANYPSESNLHDFLIMARGTNREDGGFFLRAETMFNVATEVETEGYGLYGWENIHQKSHGEAFFWVAQNRFRKRGLFILDEPESALSPQRQLALLARIHELVLQGGQFVISTHSPILMGYPNAKIVELGPHGVRQAAFEETEHYLVTRAFLENRQAMLEELLAAT